METIGMLQGLVQAAQRLGLLRGSQGGAESLCNKS